MKQNNPTPASQGSLRKAQDKEVLFQLDEKDKIIRDLRIKVANLYRFTDLSGELFVRHIQGHLDKGQEVICKICGKTVNEITHEDVYGTRISKGGGE